jgi:hypothetical protein|tara:strand:- start:838 stop:1080 length:243 start_codon:yes stop_codon:yes gene_type:complete
MNYEKIVMIQAYDILTRKDFRWTNEFSEEMKKSFLQLLLDYFTDIEHYEKCAVIVKLQNKNLENMNENISKTIKSGSGIR